MREGITKLTKEEGSASVRNDNEVVAPEDCLIMISFNDGSAGENAEALARFLTKNDYPTFCTRIYCPANAGDWRDVTLEGVKTCKLYIPLLTNGWQKSKECQWETRIIIKRIADQDVNVIVTAVVCKSVAALTSSSNARDSSSDIEN